MHCNGPTLAAYWGAARCTSSFSFSASSSEMDPGACNRERYAYGCIDETCCQGVQFMDFELLGYCGGRDKGRRHNKAHCIHPKTSQLLSRLMAMGSRTQNTDITGQ